eukprot:1109081-Rhodomonas_salina.1
MDMGRGAGGAAGAATLAAGRRRHVRRTSQRAVGQRPPRARLPPPPPLASSSHPSPLLLGVARCPTEPAHGLNQDEYSLSFIVLGPQLSLGSRKKHCVPTTSYGTERPPLGVDKNKQYTCR